MSSATPALDAWRERGETTRFDGLWRAACAEANALEGDREGLTPETVARWRRAAVKLRKDHHVAQVTPATSADVPPGEASADATPPHRLAAAPSLASRYTRTGV